MFPVETSLERELRRFRDPRGPVRVRLRKNGAYEVCWTRGKGDVVQRPRARHWTPKDALECAKAKLKEIRNFGADLAGMTYPQRASAFRFQVVLDELGLSWDAATNFIRTNWRGPKKGVPVGQLVDEFKASRRDDLEASGSYLRQIDFAFAPFLKHVGLSTPCELITSAVILGYFETPAFRKLAKATRHGYRAVLRCCFQYALPKGYVETNPVAATETFKPTPTEPKIYTVAEVVELVKAAVADDETRLRWGRPSGMAVLAGFLWTGIRREEMKRIAKPGDPARAFEMKPRSFRLTDGHEMSVPGTLRLSSDVTKTDKPRAVPMQPNLKAWWDRYGLPLWWEGWDYWFRKICRKAGVERHDNALRKTWESHTLAKFQNAALVARWGGHSILVQATYYEQLLDQEEGEKFYGLVPLEAGKVVQMVVNC